MIRADTYRIPDGCRCVVDGTLGKLKASSPPGFFATSCTPSFDLRLLKRLPVRLSALSLAADSAFFDGVSVGVAIALGSYLGELGVLDEECLRWWIRAGDRLAHPPRVLARVEQARHVQGFLRTT